jgi:hypothetical protein
LAVGIGVTVCTLESFITGNVLILFNENKLVMEFWFYCEDIFRCMFL